MSAITSTTTTTTSHRAALAGGITATLEPSINGATLTLCDGEPRALCLPILPAQMDEMLRATSPYQARSFARIWNAIDWFLETARRLVPGSTADELCGLCDDDVDILRALAVALLGEDR